MRNLRKTTAIDMEFLEICPMLSRRLCYRKGFYDVYNRQELAGHLSESRCCFPCLEFWYDANVQLGYCFFRVRCLLFFKTNNLGSSCREFETFLDQLLPKLWARNLFQNGGGFVNSKYMPSWNETWQCGSSIFIHIQVDRNHSPQWIIIIH